MHVQLGDNAISVQKCVIYEAKNCGKGVTREIRILRMNWHKTYRLYSSPAWRDILRERWDKLSASNPAPLRPSIFFVCETHEIWGEPHHVWSTLKNTALPDPRLATSWRHAFTIKIVGINTPGCDLWGQFSNTWPVMFWWQQMIENHTYCLPMVFPLKWFYSEISLFILSTLYCNISQTSSWLFLIWRI